jgi:tRNA(adenine34) deaminase
MASMQEKSLDEFDRNMMRLAIQMALKSAVNDEVPVGAVLVDKSGEVLAAAGNDCISACDPVGHAEIRVLREAALKLHNYRLPGTSLYVTLEPCSMCASAIVHARVERLIFGAVDPKTGAIVSQYQIGSDGKLNHRISILGGILADECSWLLKNFFRNRR